MSPKQHTVHQCQHQSARGRRCHMLIDAHHRPANGAARPTLCAYHAGRLLTAAPAVDPEVLAADLLGDIDAFTTADEVNLLLGNLIKQLARKRIARRDAIALAYISQLLLNSLTVMAKEHDAAEADQVHREFLERALKPRSVSSPSEPLNEPLSEPPSEPLNEPRTQPHKERPAHLDEPATPPGTPS